MILRWLDRFDFSRVEKRVLSGSFWLVLGTAFSRILTFMTNLFLARNLGREMFGEFGMVQSTMGMYGMFSGFGLGSTTAKYISELRHKDPLRTERIINLTNTSMTISNGLFALVVLFLSSWLSAHILNRVEMADLLRLGTLLLIFSGINSLQMRTLSGWEKFKDLAWINFIQSVALFAISVPTALLWGVRGAIIGLVGSYVVSYIIIRQKITRECHLSGINLRFFQRDSFKEWPILLKFSLPAMMNNTLNVPVFWVGNTILVNQAKGYQELGLFSAANQWRNLIIIFPQILASVILPILSHAHGSKNRSDFEGGFRINLELTWAVALPSTIALILLNRPLAGLYGEGFSGVNTIMVLILLTSFLVVINNAVSTAITSTGKMWSATALTAGWAIIFIILSMILIPMHLAKGLALANLGAYIAYTLFVFIYAYRYLSKEVITRQLGSFLVTVVIYAAILWQPGRLSHLGSFGIPIFLASFWPAVSLIRGRRREYGGAPPG
jgi:O-antigen/teichoic acid export membrane protein